MAATTLATYDGDLPAVLRPLSGFDPRRLGSGPARQQLHRALEVDAAFFERVGERFLALDEASAALEAWSTPLALRRIDEAAARSDLPLLASVLFAARPAGWEFALGVLCASFDRQRAEKERDDDAKAREMQLTSLDEARRRAEATRDDARAIVDRLEAQLHDERRGRRDRELRADRAIEDAARRREESEASIAQAEAAAADAEARVAREAARAREAEQRLRDLRRETADRDRARSRAGGLAPDEVRALSEAARDAQRLATRLDGLTKLTASASASTGSGDPTGGTRLRVPCPPGLQADSADGLDAMLRTRGVQLVIDGYNVSMEGWSDAPVADQRERLVAALARLHLRLRCDVVVVFDGADVAAPPPMRRPGVRVLFSSGGEKADPVVVREVARLSNTTAAIVVSSDQWVQDQAAAEGATVVSSGVLLEVLRR
jgi:predicted RNA-binding protein with PIN domain